MVVLWTVGQFDLGLDMKDNWYIAHDMKVILRYSEEKKAWMGVKNCKIVKIHWETFRDIINIYQVQ